MLATPTHPNAYPLAPPSPFWKGKDVQYITVLDAADDAEDGISGAGTFGLLEKNKHTLVLFFTQWSHDCREVKPAFVEAATRLHDMQAQDGRQGQVQLAALDCGAFSDECQHFGVQHYPTLIFFRGLKPHAVFPLDWVDLSSYSAEAIVSFVTDPPAVATHVHSHKHTLEGAEPIKLHGRVRVLAEDTSAFLKRQAGRSTMVFFFSSSCGLSIGSSSAVNELAESVWSFSQRSKTSEPVLVSVAALDCDSHMELCRSHGVQGTPNFRLFKPTGDSVRFAGMER